MKDKLTQFIEQIVDSIPIKVDKYNVYSKNDTLPKIIESIRLQSDYLICVWVNSTDTAIAKEQYERFLHKQVGIIKNCHHSVLYWFEGFRLKTSIEKTKIKEAKQINEKPNKIVRLKNSTVLPTWLQQSIFEKHQAKYAPDHERYEKNLNLLDDELKIYLGTYFPRSYGESFCIFNNVFDNKHYADLATKKEINILDIGCGTGGNLIGLLVAINKYSLATKNVNIIAVDGHSNALNILTDLVNKFANRAIFTISLTTKTQIIHSVKDLDCLTNSNFDFIMSFKMGCELIAEGNADFYYDLSKFSLPKLSQTGLFLLLDVTTRVGINYNPILLNSQINKSIKELGVYKTLIPITCGEFEKECLVKCFTQRTFKISHSLKRNDKSKVTYRILANANLVNQVTFFEQNCIYTNIPERNVNSGKYCPQSKGELEKDNYRI